MPKINNPQNYKGENLISKEALGLDADDVLITSGGVVDADFLPEITALEKDTDGKMQTVSKTMGPKINFIGDCAVRQNADGSLTIRIGENLNSSNFMTTDGQTTGVNNLKVNLPTTKSGLLATNSTIKGVTAGSYTLDTTTAAGLIHIDNPDTTSFVLNYKVDGVAKTMEFGPINMWNGDTLKTSATFTNGIAKLTISNFGPETKSAEGATGYCGNIAFDIPVNELAAVGETVELTSLTYKNGGEGEFTDKDLGATKLFYYTDVKTKPAVGSVTYNSVSLTSTATKSGITYATAGTASATASDLTNMFTPLGVSNNVAFTSNFASNASATTTSTTATSALTLKTCCVGTPTVTATASNINGAGAALTSANDYVSGLVVYTDSIDASIDESGSTTKGRITSTGSAWVSANKLGASDLQLFNGKIVYPSINFTGYNGKNADRNYTTDTENGLGSGDKVYYVKLTFSRATMQPQLTITGTGLDKTVLKSVCVANSLAVLDDRDALITVANGGINDGYVTNTDLSKVINLSYLGVGETIDTAGAYVKIVMSGTGAEITSISLA